MQEHCESSSSHLNIFVAFFSTCWARLQLFEALDHLEDIDSGTDSAIFVEGVHDPPVEPSLGVFSSDFTDEIDPGDFITEFCAFLPFP